MHDRPLLNQRPKMHKATDRANRFGRHRTMEANVASRKGKGPATDDVITIIIVVVLASYADKNWITVLLFTIVMSDQMRKWFTRR